MAGFGHLTCVFLYITFSGLRVAAGSVSHLIKDSSTQSIFQSNEDAKPSGRPAPFKVTPHVNILGASNSRRLGRKLNSLSPPFEEPSRTNHPLRALSLTKEQVNNTEVVAQVGGTATLSCHTGHISDEVVTWLKRDDDQLLTIGQDLYATEDRRLSASLSQSSKAWELFIRDVQLSDAGQYECQLTTHPPVTFFFNLKITQAKAIVTGSREVHIEEGSQLALQCYVKDAPSPPVYIFWYHNGTMVNYERDRDLNVHHQNFTSSLVVAKVTPTDAGVYSCEPHLAKRASVIVHVVTGEKPAAMQHGINQVDAAANLKHLGVIGYFLYFLPLMIVIAQSRSYFFLSTAFMREQES